MVTLLTCVGHFIITYAKLLQISVYTITATVADFWLNYSRNKSELFSRNNQLRTAVGSASKGGGVCWQTDECLQMLNTEARQLLILAVYLIPCDESVYSGLMISAIIICRRGASSSNWQVSARPSRSRRPRHGCSGNLTVNTSRRSYGYLRQHNNLISERCQPQTTSGTVSLPSR